MTDTTDTKALQRPTRKHYDWSKAVWMDCDRCGEAHTGTVLADDGARICAGCCDSEFYSAWEDLAETAIKLLEAERQRADEYKGQLELEQHHSKTLSGTVDIVDGQRDHWMERARKAEAEIAALKSKLNQYQDIHYNGLNYNGLNLNPTEGTVIMNKSKQKCGKCGTALKIDPTVMLASLPPQPSYYCPSCDKVTAEKLEFVEQFNGKKNMSELVFNNKSEFPECKVAPWNEELLIVRGVIPQKPVIPMPKFEGFEPDIIRAMEVVFKAAMEAAGFTVKGGE